MSPTTKKTETPEKKGPAELKRAVTARTTDYSRLNIYQKLAVVQRAVDVIQKDASGYGYKYVSEAELLPKINAELYEVGLTLIPGIVESTTNVEPYSFVKKKVVKGTQLEETVSGYNITADTTFTWVNNDNPSETIVVPWAMVGDQSGSSQAFGSALTYCNRYFLLKFFHCATVNDDPDAIRAEQEQGKSKREVSDILKQCDSIVQRVVAEHPDERAALKAIITECVDMRDAKGKLIPTGDYFKITKKARAEMLLTKLTEKYGE